MACAASRLVRGSHSLASRSSFYCRHGVAFVFPAIGASLFSTERRIQDIQMNPKGHGAQILPGGVVVKTVRDEERKILAERALGNFWMMSDLKKTENKPILTNQALISEDKAQEFPTLETWTTLEEPPTIVGQVPDFFLRNNRANDPKAQCTLVAICFKQFGAQMLGTWTAPFQQAFDGNSRVEVVHLNVTEGWFLSKLQRYLTNSARKNTPQEEWPTTLLHYASNTEDPNLSQWKDILRMHNTLTAYVYLLDGLGRVRCAASGKASQEEAERMIDFAMELTPMLKEDANKTLRKNNRRR